MRDTLRVFLSSTTGDLKEFRAAAREGLEGAGWHCVCMEEFEAQSKSPAEYVENQIKKCDVLVLLAGPCYGSIVPNLGISFTELEYKVAVELGKPCLVFLTDEDFPVPVNVLLADPNIEKQKLFRMTLERDHVRTTFKRAEQLKWQVVRAVDEFVEQLREGTKVPASPLTCIVLCGGKAVRLAPLTRDTCKEAIPVAGVSALERMLRRLDEERVARSIIVSVGQEHAKQITSLANRVSMAAPVSIVPNTCQGPLHAVLQLSTQLDGKPFLLVAGDNIIEGGIINHFVASMQAKNRSGNLLYELHTGQEASLYGVGFVDAASGLLRELKEKQDVPSSLLISTACYYFLWDDAMRLNAFLNDTTVASHNIGSFISWLLAQKVAVAAYLTDRPWFDVGTREKLLRANAYYLRDRMEGCVEDGSQIKGPAMIERGTKVSGNSVVGPWVYIGRDVVIDGGSEIRNSIVMDGARIHSAGVSNSVIGSNSCVQGYIESFIVCNGAHVVREQGAQA